jgi:hypothetical protein
MPHDGSAVEEQGFNLEATVLIAHDDFGREHLLRYCARPPLSLARLIELPHGKLGYRIKKLANHRSKLRIMTPPLVTRRRSLNVLTEFALPSRSNSPLANRA